MRRKEKQITDQTRISKVIKKCQVCRLGLAKDNTPYIVPVSFGYDGSAIYFHIAAQEGMKIDYISANNNICFEFNHGVETVTHDDKPCNWSFSFQSVIGFGQVEELKSDEAKQNGLKHIMAQYSEKEWDFSDIPMKILSVWKITIESITGKQSQDHLSQ